MDLSLSKLKAFSLSEERVNEKGMVRSKAIDPEYYPDLEIEVVSPAYYYNKKHFDKYSLNILAAKRRNDLSDLFWESVVDTVNEYDKELKFKECDTITIIPSSKQHLEITPTMFSLAQGLSKHLNIKYEQLIKKIEWKGKGGESRKDRHDAISGTIISDGNCIGQKILLLDDIRASGIHILESSKVLIEAGAKRVVCLCLGTHKGDAPKK